MRFPGGIVVAASAFALGAASALIFVGVFREPLALAVLSRSPGVLADEHQLLSDAFQLLEQRRRTQEAGKVAARLDAEFAWLSSRGFHLAHGAGDADPHEGSNRVYVLTDYTCAACRALDRNIYFLLNGQPELTLVFLPVPVYGPSSEYAVRASLQASAIDTAAFAAMHERLMTTPAALLSARTLRSDHPGHDAEHSDELLRQAVARLRVLPRELTVRGLPALFYRGEPFIGAHGVKELEQILN
jgi:protein-disulfide isomerase